jgi:hypothetical protein
VGLGGTGMRGSGEEREGIQGKDGKTEEKRKNGNDCKAPMNKTAVVY